MIPMNNLYETTKNGRKYEKIDRRYDFNSS